MTPLPPVDTAAAEGIQSAFADLVCSDPDLTRAEFDAIIEANWGCADPPSCADDSEMAHEPLPDSWVVPGMPESTGHTGVGQPRTSRWSRLRSPPGPVAVPATGPDHVAQQHPGGSRCPPPIQGSGRRGPVPSGLEEALRSGQQTPL